MNLHNRRTGGARATRVIFPIIAALAPVASPADGFSVTGDLTAATDYVFRGISQTMSGAALQGSIGLAHDSGFSAWVWGSNVDYVADGDPDDGARVEINAVIAYQHAISGRLGATVGRAEYLVPGVNPGFDYDYAEWWGELTLDDRHYVAAFHSGSVFGTGQPGWYVVAGTGVDLFGGLALDVAVGHGDLAHALGDAYNHVEVSLSGELDAFGWQLAFHAADDAAKEMFYQSVVEPRLVLSVTYTVW